MTKMVLQTAPEVDARTQYRALSEPPEGLAGRSPLEAVSVDPIDDAAKAVFNVLDKS